MMQHSGVERGGIQSIQRAAALLRALAGDSALGVSELARRTGLHKSTVSRLLATLASEALVEREPGSDKYRLGLELARLAGQVARFGDLKVAAHPALLALGAEARETVHLAVRDGDEVVNVEEFAGPHLVRQASWLGRRTPLHCVANGKALLAFAPRTVIERVLDSPLSAITPRTTTDPRELRAELQRVRERGYAVALGEVEEGLHAVAAPVLGADGFAIAAVSVSGPSYRVTPERLPELGALTVATAKRIAARLGT
jgi:DNA-binding IclR family transcriptional regulator